MKIPKTTMFDYLKWRGDLSFSADPVNEVDSLIFSTLSYIDFIMVPFVNTLNPRVAPTMAEVSKILNENAQGDKKFLDLLKKCARTNRFKKVEVFGYESMITEDDELLQFAAVSFMTESGIVIAFRGTDDSFVGWGEDLKMSFARVPSQDYALDYVKKIMDACPNIPVYITGHSKGGNLAIWSAAQLDKERSARLVRVFDNDGPGFCKDFMDPEGYERIYKKTTKYVVNFSVIGMLLDSTTQQKVVANNEVNTLRQHYPMSWVVEGNKFYTLTKRSELAKATDEILREWISTLTFEEREKLTSIIVDILQSSNAKTISEIRRTEGIQDVIPMLKTYIDSDKETKKFLASVNGRLRTAIKNNATKQKNAKKAKKKGDTPQIAEEVIADNDEKSTE